VKCFRMPTRCLRLSRESGNPGPQGCTTGYRGPTLSRGRRRAKRRQGQAHEKRVEWLGTVGFFGLISGANAQTPSPSTATTQFDGTYAFVSSAKVNETYTTPSGRMGRCRDLKAGPLTIINGRVQYSGSSGLLFEGRVGSHGELTMRAVPSPTSGGSSPGVEIMTSGIIDGNGTLRARRIDSNCSYDLVRQRESK
jgi:hypothetical protein